jgi:hypothetical protein
MVKHFAECRLAALLHTKLSTGNGGTHGLVDKNFRVPGRQGRAWCASPPRRSTL